MSARSAESARAQPRPRLPWNRPAGRVRTVLRPALQEHGGSLMSCAFGPGVGRGSAAGLHHPASPRRLRGAAPSDAQRAAVRRAVRRLQDQELIEVQRRGVGRTYPPASCPSALRATAGGVPRAGAGLCGVRVGDVVRCDLDGEAAGHRPRAALVSGRAVSIRGGLPHVRGRDHRTVRAARALTGDEHAQRDRCPNPDHNRANKPTSAPQAEPRWAN